MPESAGEITSVRFDFNDDWRYPAPSENPFPIEGKVTHTEKDGAHGAFSEITRHFDEPGTYFVSVQIKSHKQRREEDEMCGTRCGDPPAYSSYVFAFRGLPSAGY